MSETGTYRTDDGVDHEAYTDLQAAIDVAANSGDWIWVEDNFVCTSEATGSARLNIDKALTISSRSGKWENGISITANGSRRCIHVTKTGDGANQVNGDVRLIGFDLSSEGSEVQFGAIYVADTWARFDLENSRVHGFSNRNPIYDQGHSSHPEIANSTIRNCIYEGNVKLSGSGNNWSGAAVCVSGCNVYDTVFRYNAGLGNASCYMTAVPDSVVSNCTFVCNTNGLSSAGGAMYVSDATGSFRCYDCNFVSNTFTRNITHGAHVRAYGRFERCNFLHGGWRQCSGAVEGFGTRGLTLVDCLVSNNVAEACGGVYNVYATNTVIACNSGSSSSYGGGAYNSCLVDCDLVGNKCDKGAGAHTCELVACRIKDNTGAYGGGAFGSTLTNCVVSGNSVLKVGFYKGEGGGLYECTAVDTVIRDNAAGYHGGGVFKGRYVNCRIFGNLCEAEKSDDSNYYEYGRGGGAYYADLDCCVVTNNTATHRGGGVFNADSNVSRNCLIADNVIVCHSDYASVRNAGGVGVWGGTYYNCLITGHANHAPYGAAVQGSWLYNSTVTDNSNDAANGCAGVQSGRAVNSIIAANTTTKTQADTFIFATNCYVSTSATRLNGTYKMSDVFVDCLRGDDPRLGEVDGFAYTPLATSLCKNRGIEFPWMRDANDIRSKDVYGHDRIIGSAPDIGAVERKGYGIMLLVR